MSVGAVTEDLAQWIAHRNDQPTPRTCRIARQVFLDWTGVALAGISDPIVGVLTKEAGRDNKGIAIPGMQVRYARAAAARISGASSHALDFDDINKRMRGHPSVAIIPALLAAADTQTYADVINALIVGTEVACVLGEMLGEAHYARGFHTTATVGTVAAAAAVCRLENVDEDTTCRALSIAATQASGLRAMFGTMVKPLHAGLAAERGLMAARWAKNGMTAPRDGIESDFGMGAVLSDGFQPFGIRSERSAPFGIEENVFKRHAACYYTHSAIEAVQRLCTKHDLSSAQIDRITVGLQPGLLGVCDIQEPSTGLEVKFSVRHLVAMILAKRDTTDPNSYTTALAQDADLIALRQRVNVTSLETDNRMLALVTIKLSDGRDDELMCDVSAPAIDLSLQEYGLTKKFIRLARPIFGGKAETIASEILTAAEHCPFAQLLHMLIPET